MKIYVGRKEIKNGFRSSCSRCPIALAVMKAFKLDVTIFAISVGGCHISIGKRPIWNGSPNLQYDPFGDKNSFDFKYRVNGKIGKFVNAFDGLSANAKLDPMTFYIPNIIIRKYNHILGVTL